MFIPFQEKVLATPTCPITNETFPVTEWDRRIIDLAAPVIAGVRYEFPDPKLFYVERERLRLNFIRGSQLYRRKCVLTGKDLITYLSPDSKYQICHDDAWHSDALDPLTNGRDYDFDRSFFEQFHELAVQIPVPHSGSTGSENADYGWVLNSKDCYFLFIGMENEQVYYSSQIIHCTTCMDCFDLRFSNQCYHCVQSVELNNCRYVYKSERVSDSDYCFACRNCDHCLFSHNLANASYCIGNVPYSKEEYERKRDELFGSANREELNRKFFEKAQEFIVPALSMVGSENCIGDGMVNCKDCFFIAGLSTDSQNCRYATYANYNRDCMDATSYSGDCCYEIPSGWSLHNCAFCYEMQSDCQRTYYSSYLAGCTDCFGCVGLRNKSYCVFNTQYSKDAYETLVPRIIEHMKKTGEWGRFFPANLSPFGYNDSMANQRLPLTREKALALGFQWFDYEPPAPKADKTIPAAKLPSKISQVPDDILNWAIVCEVSGKPFRIVREELELYRRYELPIPKKHPSVRYRELAGYQNPPIFRTVRCAKTGEETITTYPESAPYQIWSEQVWKEEFMQ